MTHTHDSTARPHYSLLWIDLDRAAHLNRRLGRRAVNDLLRHIEKRILGCVRPGDTVYRSPDADEFRVTLPDAGTDEAAAVALRICAAVRRLTAGGLPVSVSVGQAEATECRRYGLSAAEGAELAFLLARAEGGGAVRVWTPVTAGLSNRRRPVRRVVPGSPQPPVACLAGREGAR